MAVPDAFVVVSPTLTISAVDWVGAARKISLVPTDKQADISHFRNPDGKRPSSTSWMCEIDWVQSYGTEGSWNVLHLLAKTLVVMTAAPADSAAAVTNPVATFSLYFPSIPFMNAGVGEATEFTSSSQLVGAPVFDTGA